MRPSRSFVVLGLSLLTLTVGCGGPPPPPAFYARDSRLDGVQPGDVLRSEPLKGAPPGASAWRVVYASTGMRGEPIEVSGVVIAPDLAPPPGGRPVIAWAHPTTGVADRCAPSTNPEFFDTIPHLPALMLLDYVVAATDYAGLGTPGPHPYMVGGSEARSVLDSVRAAGRLAKTGAGPRFVVWGHSQGGHAALFTGQLAKVYAPDLALVGVAAIAPATDLKTLLRDDLGERVGKVLTAYALWSWSQVYDVGLETAIRPSAIPGVDEVARDCVETTGEGYRVGFDSLELGGSFVNPGALESAPWKELLERNSPGAAPIGAPIFIAQGTDDPVVRPAVTADFVRDLCRRRELVRYEELPGATHLRAANISASSAIRWMRARLEGQAPPNTCAGPSL